MITLNRSDGWNQTTPAVSTSAHTYASFQKPTENRDEGKDIMREDYPKSYALYAFDSSPNLAEEGHINLA